MTQHLIAGAGASAANPCVTCTVGCCHRHTVNIGGYDVWTIARGLGLEPGLFIHAVAHRDMEKNGFMLRPGGPRYELALIKRPTGAAYEPCMFLIELPDGTGRCGIYELRPQICRSYPAFTRRGMVFRRDDVVCPEGAWGDGALERPEWYESVVRHNVEHDIYNLVLARWNYRVRYGQPGADYTLADYLDFIVCVYNRLEPVRADLPPEQWRELFLQWEHCLDRMASPLLEECPELQPWQPTVAAIRGAINGFFQDDLQAHLEDEMAAWEAEQVGAGQGPEGR